MDEKKVLEDVLGILKPFVKSPELLAAASMETSIQQDLKINSARMVDVVLELEDHFDITVADDEAEKVRKVGDAVKLVLLRKGGA
jgi:acyl carrier protein